jgi:nicotinate phosphoribosyltransferase
MYTGKDIFRPALMTDLYQLTMAAGYRQSGLDHEATFELFIRSLPRNRSYFVAAGLEQAVEYLLHLRFGRDEIEWLGNLPVFRNISKEFFSSLETFRFSGDMWAVPEGTPVFANEPILQVRAPLMQAQILETFLLSVIHFQTLIATKASRVVQSAESRAVVDFGTRRAHGPEAGVLAARASYIGGCTGTSNVWAGKTFQIPVVGTAAHSWTMAFGSEREAFEQYHALFPDSTVLLIDTFDTIQGVRNAISIGEDLKGVRLDSGDLLMLSKDVRRILDEAGLRETRILASGDLNEHKIHGLLKAGAPIDFFGVGTEMVTSKDLPALGAVYKLVEMKDGEKTVFCAKFSEGKATYPGRKQIWRIRDEKGGFLLDEIGTPEEKPSEEAFPLLIPIVERGEGIYMFPPLRKVRDYALTEMEKLSPRYRRLESQEVYPVRWASTLEDRFRRLKRESVAVSR